MRLAHEQHSATVYPACVRQCQFLQSNIAEHTTHLLCPYFYCLLDNLIRSINKSQQMGLLK